MLSLIVFIGALSVRAQRGGQTSFGMETEIKRKHLIPRYVVEQIIKNEECFSMEEIDSLSKKIEGSLINLNDDGKSDLFVQGDNGANITGFWLFRSSGGKWRLVLYSRAAWFDIKKTLTKGFHDIEIRAASAVTMWGSIYKFNGITYVPKLCWAADLGRRGEKRSYSKCPGSSIKPYV